MPLAVLQSPGPLLVELGPLAIRWYGLLIALAVLLGLWVSSRLAKMRGLEAGVISDLLPLIVLGAIIGARLYYVIFEWRQYQINWLEAFQMFKSLPDRLDKRLRQALTDVELMLNAPFSRRFAPALSISRKSASTLSMETLKSLAVS
jgi:hypothetical protein